MNKLNLSLVFMEMCYNVEVFQLHGKPYRPETDMDGLPCPPRGRTADLHNSKHDGLRNYWLYFIEMNGMVAGCAPLMGRLARIRVFISGQIRASGECMGTGKCAFCHAVGMLPDGDNWAHD